MPPVGFEPAISAGERPQTYALDRAATATGTHAIIIIIIIIINDRLCGLVVRVSGYRYRGLGFDSRRYQIF